MSGLTAIMIGQVAENRQFIVRVMSLRMYSQCNKMIVYALHATLTCNIKTMFSPQTQIHTVCVFQHTHCFLSTANETTAFFRDFNKL